MRLFEIASLLHCPVERDLELAGITIDSRTAKPGQLFVAIRGERFDGHQFIGEVAAAGVAGVVCEERDASVTIPQLVVKDTIQALAAIATYHRQRIHCPTIALTGSNGKTTVKEMIAAILPKPSYATPGNLNNHIGVPLCVLQLEDFHRSAVFELGANHLGEIAHTVAIVQPQVTLINNIAPAHIAGFGSIEGVVRAKGEIYQGLCVGGTAVVNDDDTYAHAWDDVLVNKKTLRFSIRSEADVHARGIAFDEEGLARFVLVVPGGEMPVALRVVGLHNVSNALAAAACAHALGIALPDIVSGLCQFSGVAGRMTFLRGKGNALVIDDTYNANLRSSLTAIEVLAKCKGRRIFVFGDMGELGSFSEQHHEEVGAAARTRGIDVLMTCGSQSQAAARAYGASGLHYLTQEALVNDLLKQLDDKTTILVKGSRASAMEKIVHRLVS